MEDERMLDARSLCNHARRLPVNDIQAVASTIAPVRIEWIERKPKVVLGRCAQEASCFASWNPFTERLLYMSSHFPSPLKECVDDEDLRQVAVRRVHLFAVVQLLESDTKRRCLGE